MAKVKYNEETGAYKLKLNHAQLELIAKYCAVTVLGNAKDDEYRAAALDIMEAIDQGIGSDFIAIACDNIKMDAVIQNDDTISGPDLATIKDDSLALRVTTNENYTN